MNKPIVFSGAQPSGRLTIGNYIGAIRHWARMQQDHRCIYCIVDLHSITTWDNLYKLYTVSLDTLALYLACGINPNISTIFLQSHVPEHSQLHWILSCYVYFGELKRMNQFKEKLGQCKFDVNVGLFNYPVLMASDILLYKTDLVPVGSDQKQHLELTRSIVRRFNSRYNATVFTMPKMCTSNFSTRIMSLLDPRKKMSKSDRNSNNYIALLDDIDVMSGKIMRAITDSDTPPVICYDPIKKPGISNLLSILSGVTENSISNLEKTFKGKTYFQLKIAVIQSLSSLLIKLQRSYYHERSDENKLNRILHIGAKKARDQARCTLQQVHEIIGLINMMHH